MSRVVAADRTLIVLDRSIAAYGVAVALEDEVVVGAIKGGRCVRAGRPVKDDALRLVAGRSGSGLFILPCPSAWLLDVEAGHRPTVLVRTVRA